MRTSTYKYLAGAGDNQVVLAGPCILRAILFGADVANADVEISDHASDGDGAIIAQFTGSTLMTSTGGGVQFGPEGIHLFKGLTLDSTNQTKITVVYSPA